MLITFGTRLYQLYSARDCDWREVGVGRRLRGRRRGCWRWSSRMPFGGKVVHTPRKVVFDFEDLWFKTFRVITILNGVLGGGSCGCSRSRRWGCWRWSSVMPFGGMVVHHLRKIMINFEDFWLKTFWVIMILNGVFGGRRTFVFRRCCSLLF